MQALVDSFAPANRRRPARHDESDQHTARTPAKVNAAWQPGLEVSVVCLVLDSVLRPLALRLSKLTAILADIQAAINKRRRSRSDTMATFQGLPDDVIQRILSLLEPKRYGVGYRRDSKSCLSLMLASRRFVRPCMRVLYSTATISRPNQFESFINGLVKLPVKTLKHIEIFPSARWVVHGEEGFHIPPKCIERLAEHGASVETLDIYPSGQDGSSTLQADPASYLPLFLIINPRRLRVQCSMSPICAQLITYGRVPQFDVIELVQPSARYTFLQDLHVPFLKFGADVEDTIYGFAHLPLRRLRFDWPRGLTPTMVLAILRLFKSTFDRRGFTIAAPAGWLESVCGCIPDGGNIKTSTEWFIENNPGLTMLALQNEARSTKEESLLEYLDWQIQEYDFLALWTVPVPLPVPSLPILPPSSSILVPRAPRSATSSS